MSVGNPILSIAVPSYNVEQYLEKGLSTYDDPRLEGLLEVLVVNDGSTDGTVGIAEEFVQRRPGVFRLINKENGGHGSAINAGLDAAAGTYFRIIDGDDWANTDNLVKLCEKLNQTDADLVVDVKQEVHMVTGETELFPLPSNIPLDKKLNFEDICTDGTIAAFIMIHTLSAKTEMLRAANIKLLEKTFYVDLEYIVKCTLQAETIEFINLNVTQYLVGNANQSVADNSYVNRWADHTRVTEEILRLYQDQQGKLSENRAQYLFQRTALLCNTHYNIALIFDKDRKRGLKRAKDFRAYMNAGFPEIAAATDKRYRMGRVLHTIGVDSQEKLNKMRG